MTDLALQLNGEEVVATAERGLVWPSGRTLFVADVHFGKDATFRRADRWVPFGTTANDLERLERLIFRHKIKHLVILGDAFHSEHAEEAATRGEIARWRERHGKIEMILVAGNHDRRARRLAGEIGFRVEEEGFVKGPWGLCHHPPDGTDRYTLCGHIHPQVSLAGRAHQSLRVPCFWLREDYGVLPAFGGFTGGATVRPRKGDRVVLVADGQVLEA